MAKFHKETMKEKIERLEKEVAFAEKERHELWLALNEVTKAKTIGEISTVIESSKAIVDETARCSCGRRASMWNHGTGPLMCETCMSS